jgi:hypothetical protein
MAMALKVCWIISFALRMVTADIYGCHIGCGTERDDILGLGRSYRAKGARHLEPT